MPNSLKNELIKKHTIANIGTFYCYDHFMISEINEGVIVDLKMTLEVTNTLTKKYYGRKKPFVYITNRVNSYSMDPTIHFETAKMLPNTLGYAIVTYDKTNTDVANLEKAFLKIPIQIFHSLDQAVQWAESIIPKD
ncbi:hypothetical protein [Aquimarina spongiae]|uniref:STAS/SEC14 domain-containing protein n=1 Tax=Aquimarina spongiae TaxID=570521 RepID=A0A1M6K674_9FLAO|nr:hypothetical protein [Aquimarina spongiae]SHJ54429.1 hypothetical protein SAMN04488508_11095 [Aquimarina spongiae]